MESAALSLGAFRRGKARAVIVADMNEAAARHDVAREIGGGCIYR